MNYQNRKRHLISKLTKAKNRGFNTFDVINDVQDFIGEKYCRGCIHEDFGHCDCNLRDEERHTIYCIPQAIKHIESEG